PVLPATATGPEVALPGRSSPMSSRGGRSGTGFLWVVVASASLAPSARADDAPAAAVVQAAKAATVLVKVEVAPFGGSGSGFVVRVDRDVVYVVTNQHV